MKANLNKRLLLLLAVFMVLVLIPTSFAADTTDGDAVGIDDDSAVDTISESAVSDDIISDDSKSAISEIDDNQLAADGEEEEIDDNIYVDGNAAPGGNGSKEKPFQNVSAAYDSAADGKTIIIKSGEYSIGSRGLFNNVNGLNIDKNITFTGEGDVKFKSIGYSFIGTQFITIDQNAANVAFNNIQFVDSRLSLGNALIHVSGAIINTRTHDLIFNNCTFKNISADSIITADRDIILRRDRVNLELSNSVFLNNTLDSLFTVTGGTANNNFWGDNGKPTINNVKIDDWIIVKGSLSDEYPSIGNTYPVSLELVSTDGTTETPLDASFQDIELTLSSVLNAIEPNLIKISDNIATFDYVAAEGGDEVISFVNGRSTIPIFDFHVCYVAIDVQKINEGEAFIVNVKASEDTPNVTVTINGVDYVIELTDGIGTQTIEPNLKPGTYEIVVDSGDGKVDVYAIEVKLKEMNFTFNISNNAIGKNATVKVIPSIESFANNITVFVNGKEYNVTKESNYTLTTDVLKAGTYGIVAVFYGDEYTKNTDGSTSFTLAKQATAITAKNLSIKTYVKAVNGKNTRYFIATLKDAKGKALANKVIQFIYNGKTKKVTTNKKGQAKFLIGTKVKGTYYIVASFLGDGAYNPSFVSRKVKINPQKVKIKAKKKTFKRSKKVKKYTVTLKASNGKAIKGKKLVLTINKKKYTKKTNKKGKAIFKLKKLSKKKTYKVKIKFAGDKYFKKATKKSKIKVK